MLKSRVNDADLRHRRGFNCAQAVACTYCDLLGVNEVTALRGLEAFGAGIAASGSTCGAVCGLLFLAGLKNSSGDLQNRTSKGATVRLGTQLLQQFESWNGSALCRELKGLATGKVLRSCSGCIKDAARLAEDVLFAGQFEPYTPRTEEE